MHINEVKNNAFYQFPQWLLKEEPYKNLGDKAKMMYMLLFDRRTLSIKNKWYDGDGQIYMYFTNEQFMKELNCANGSVVKAKKELAQVGLLKETRQGMNKPNRLYIAGYSKTEFQDVQKLDVGYSKTEFQDVQKLDGINTNNINTNISNNKYINSSLGDSLKRLNWLDEIQMQRIMEYVGIDGMNIDVVQNAIERCADSNIRNFYYLNSILKNWSQKGIKTLEQVAKDDEEHKQAEGFKKQSWKSKNDDFVGFGIQGSGYQPMSEFTNTRSTLMPFPEAKMEQSKEWCDKHQCQMVKIAKTGAVICPQCNKEERLNFEEQKAQASYERNEEKKRIYYLEDFSLMDNELKNATFDNFKADTPERQADLDFIKKEAREYIKGAQNNIVLIGDCGVGKSHLAYSAVKAISDYNKKLATVINVVDLVAKVKEDFSLESYYTNLLSGKDKHDQIEYLVLDDLGTEKTSEWSSNLIYSILNKRTNTIITTNLTPPEIQRRYGKRIFSRVFKGVGQEHVYQFKNRTDERMSLWG